MSALLIVLICWVCLIIGGTFGFSLAAFVQAAKAQDEAANEWHAKYGARLPALKQKERSL